MPYLFIQLSYLPGHYWRVQSLFYLWNKKNWPQSCLFINRFLYLWDKDWCGWCGDYHWVMICAGEFIWILWVFPFPTILSQVAKRLLSDLCRVESLAVGVVLLYMISFIIFLLVVFVVECPTDISLANFQWYRLVSVSLKSCSNLASPPLRWRPGWQVH